MMKLAVPLTAPGEAGILSDAGATEFYCGVQTEEWINSFGDHDSISRRQGAANLSTLDELNSLVAETVALHAPLFLTVNGCYTQDQLPPVLELVTSFEDMGGAGIMVMDIALLSLLKKRNSRLIRGLSLLAAVSNRSALEFYTELGVSRVVFPRFLQPDQIGAITKEFPDVTAESIVWIDKCKFIDGYCRFIHSVGYRDALTPDADSEVHGGVLGRTIADLPTNLGGIDHSDILSGDTVDVLQDTGGMGHSEVLGRLTADVPKNPGDINHSDMPSEISADVSADIRGVDNSDTLGGLTADVPPDICGAKTDFCRPPQRSITSYDTNYMLPACFELFGHPPDLPACAACRLKALEGAGVSIFKIGGRGRSLDTRLSGMRFLSLAYKIADDRIKELYEESFGAPCNPEVCYLELP